ncbi:MAG: M23 family metallopeptidase [Chitinophagaceae bacterium]|nr:MAG: M23 family metallopeptidase [Chitinophagaceae bacterium]
MAIPRRLVRFCKRLLVFLLVVFTVVIFFFFYHNKVTGNLDEYVYELPFAAGDRHRVVQGYGGLFSHSHIAAIDFAMPVGTPVHAARSGTVFSFRDDSDEGGVGESYKRKANYLMIRHDDGSFGCYWHLALNGVLVKKGRVEKGQPIALSGATGLVVRPHLHFSVKRRLNYDMDSFVRTIFRTAKGEQLLLNGRAYKRPE